MDKLHVVILPSWYPDAVQPGQGVFFKEQALALQQAGLKVGVVYPELWGPRTLIFSDHWMKDPHYFQTVLATEDGLVTLRLKGWAVRRTWPTLTTWAISRLMALYVQRFGRPDLIHVHGALWAGVAASRVAPNLGLPYVLTEHYTGYGMGNLQRWQKPLVRQALVRAKSRIAVSSALAEDLKPYAEELHIEVVPNVVHTDFFFPPISRPAAPPFRLLTIAFLEKRKRIDLVIQALARLVAQGFDVHLEIGGDGAERSRLEWLAQNLGVSDRITFLGFLSREEVRQALHRSHLFVLPSEYETFGVVYIEALSTGLPVIATRCGGPEDFVIPEVGILVPKSDVEALVRAIAETIHNYEKYDPTRIRTYAEQNFSAKAVSERLIGIYERVLKEE